MRIIILPTAGKANPYQVELARALESCGAMVVVTDAKGRFPLLRAVRAWHKPNIIHLHWTHSFIVANTRMKTIAKGIRFLVELALLKAKRIKVIWTVHNLLEHEKRHPFLELFFTRLAVRLYDHIIVHCCSAREAVMKTYHLPHWFRNKITVIPHPNYIGSYENSISQAEARQRLGLAEKEIVFLYIGQIRPYKGVPYLLDVFLKFNVPRVRLVVAGKPSSNQLQREIERKAKQDPRVLLRLEFIPAEELQVYLNAADVVVLPYKDILTSGAAVLAMSFGKPVIAPKLGCVAELIEEGVGGFLYDPEDEDGLLDAMRKAITANLRALGEYNLQKARELDWLRAAKATLEVYQRCLGCGAQPNREG